MASNARPYRVRKSRSSEVFLNEDHPSHPTENNKEAIDLGGGESSYKVLKPITSSNLRITVGEGKGIQWRRNSCYIDASLFSMFAFSSAFDYTLNCAFGPDHPHMEDSKKLQMILRDKIVNPLRSGLLVPPKATSKLRKMLAKWNRGFRKAPMEPQEFLILLFRDIFEIEPFLVLNDDNGSDYFHNVLMHQPSSFDLKTYTPSIQTIIHQSFRMQHVKFQASPAPALLLPLALRCSNTKIIKPFKAIVPNLSIDITEFTTSEGAPVKCELQLSAVICVFSVKSGTRHFVTFVKCGPAPDATWVYFDSAVTVGKTSTPQVKHLNTLGTFLMKLEKDPSLIGHYLEHGDKYIKMILMDPYMYIYV